MTESDRDEVGLHKKSAQNLPTVCAVPPVDEQALAETRKR
jgi:hypothetical protein